MGDDAYVDDITRQREQMIKAEIRFAEDSESGEVQRILRETGLFAEGMDWAHVHPSWMVAEYKGTIVGVVQVLIGHPMGHMGFLAVSPKYQSLGFGVHLWKAAEKMFALSGCDAYTAMTDHPHILRKLGRIGAVVFGPPVSWVFKRVAQIKVPRERLQANESLSPTGT